MRVVTRLVHVVSFAVALLVTSAAHGQATTGEAAVVRVREDARKGKATAGLEAVHTRWAGFAPRFQEHVCPFPNGSEYAGRVSCGYVLVPEDRTDPLSRQIKLSVMRVAALEGAQADRAVVLLAGGPGQPGIDIVVNFMLKTGRLAPFFERADLIAFDQRGVGYSEPSFCRAVPRPWERGVAMIPDGEARFRHDMRRCLDEARDQGIAVDAYSTWHNAHDVRDVRLALGYTRWNLLGGSYGTRLAQAVMQIDATGVRSAILDSVIPAVLPADGPWVGLAFGLRSSLNAIGDACAKHARCADEIGDLPRRLEAAILAYNSSPVVLEHSGDSIETGRVVLDGQLVASTIFVTLYTAQLYGGLPIFLKALEDRDADALAAYVTPLLGALRTGHSFGTGMNFVTNCRSDFITTSPSVRASEPLSRWTVEPQLGDNATERCKAAYRIDPDASVVELESDIPTLILSGLADPATPPTFARAILPGLAKARLLEFRYVGHGVLPTLSDLSPACGDQILADFVSDPEGPIDTSCANAIRAPDFVTRVRHTKRPLRFVSSIREGAGPAVPSLIAAALLFTIVAFPVAAIGRRIDGRTGPSVGKIRLLSWLGATLSFAGGAVAAWAMWRTVSEYPMVLPLGVLPWVGWGGWLGSAGVLASLSGAVQYLRTRHNTRGGIGTEIGVCATVLLSVAFLVFLMSIGAGPV